MTAWVLVWALGSSAGFAINGIASEPAYHELAAKLGFTRNNIIAPDYKCVPYMATR